MVLTKRCVAVGDLDGARWAASRALVAAPEDELLLCARLYTEHAAGNRLEVERLVSWIARNARNLGVDMLPDTVKLLQYVLGTSPPRPDPNQGNPNPGNPNPPEHPNPPGNPGSPWNPNPPGNPGSPWNPNPPGNPSSPA